MGRGERSLTVKRREKFSVRENNGKEEKSQIIEWRINPAIETIFVDV